VGDHPAATCRTANGFAYPEPVPGPGDEIVERKDLALLDLKLVPVP
jgi:hypothetical protein